MKKIILVLLVIATVCSVVLVTKQRRLVSCLLFSHTEPVTDAQIEQLKSEGVTIGANAIELTESSYDPSVEIKRSNDYDATVDISPRVVPGLSNGLARCLSTGLSYSPKLIVVTSYLSFSVIVGWIVLLVRLILSRRRNHG